MEINTTVPPSLPITPNPPKFPETDLNETPTKPQTTTNGGLKRHSSPPLLSPPTSAAAAGIVIYKQCMKNHAVTRGGHALDGCGEFMPSPTMVASDPTSLKCVACGCHRNFHRRVSPGAALDDTLQPPPLAATPTMEYQPHHPPPPPTHHGRSPNSQSPRPISSTYHSAPDMLFPLGGGNGGSNPGAGAAPAFRKGRKRFRSKFTQDQKEKMHEFAEKVEWKIQKTDRETVAQFCNEIGVERGTFKVWMHNNKNTLGKKGLNDNTNTGNKENNGCTGNNDNNDNNGNNEYSKNGVGANGSSSCS